ncbi:MAG: ATP-binding protein, partial [Pseudomonadota bacterium]|nr:ATP-binding protein [Pseudomonadota bacterium]
SVNRAAARMMRSESIHHDMPEREASSAKNPMSLRLAMAWDGSEPEPWQRDLLDLFVRNQLRAAPVLPLLAVILAFVSMRWSPALHVTAWLIATTTGHALQHHLCRRHANTVAPNASTREWISQFTAAELFLAACWSLPLVTFWQAGNQLHNFFLIAILMAVAAARMIIASNFVPIILAGTGFITIAIIVRCVMGGDPLYLETAAVALVIEVLLLQLTRRLQDNARDMLNFKRQREQLIERLELAKSLAEEQRSKAEEANSAKSKFLATMSHELRTPLNAIMGYSEILSLELMGPHTVTAYKGYAHDIRYSGQYLLSLINDILDLSRIEAGRQELNEEAISLSEAGEESLRLVEAHAASRNLTLRPEFDAALPQLLADKRQIRQMWLNLLSNAIKFTPEGGAVTMATARSSAGGVSLIVRDTGPGIPAHEMASLRGAFVRGSYASRRAIDGAGLGLSIVNGFARLHGGELVIESTPGNGTTVIVNFPAERILTGKRPEPVAPQQSASHSQRKLIAVTA